MFDRQRLIETLALFSYELIGEQGDAVWFAVSDPEDTPYDIVVFDLSRGTIPKEDLVRVLLDAGVPRDEIDRVLGA